MPKKLALIKLYLLVAPSLVLSLVSLLILSQLDQTLFYKQLLFCLIGIVIFGLIQKLKPHFYFQVSPLIYVGVNLLLLITLIFGGGRGASRWLSLGSFTLQASQLAVPLTGLFLAYFISIYSLTKFKHALLALAIIGLPAVLIFLEPDLGTSLWLLLPAGLTLFVFGLPWRYLTLFSLGGLIALTFTFAVLLKPYQRERLRSFIQQSQKVSANQSNPASPSDYNRAQALIAIGSGGVWGKGIGRGTQSQLRFLPEKQTDFIFATLTEEGGLIMALIVVTSLALMVAWLLFNSSQLASPASIYLFYLGSLMAWQTVINLGANLGLLPITGLPLPLISYGGSSLLGLAFALGLANNIIVHSAKISEI